MALVGLFGYVWKLSLVVLAEDSMSTSSGFTVLFICGGL